MKRQASLFSALVGVQLTSHFGKRGKQYRQYHGKVILTDEQVMECRRLHETQGLTIDQLLFRFNLEHRYWDWMRGVLEYQLRSSPSRPRDPKLGR